MEGRTRCRGAPASRRRADSVTFSVSRRSGGVFVERHVERVGKGLVLHAMRFIDETAFLSWCMADRLQFEFPLVYSNLRRAGCALFSDLS